MADKQDSNLTGLRYAEEQSLKVLPGSPIWYALEPNSYSDFGGQLKTVARNPINPTRQRKKGTITDLDASGGFNQDLTLNNLVRAMQGFFFADIREKSTTFPMNGTEVDITAITAAADDYTAASGLPTTIVSGHLLFASGFGVTGNNGLKVANGTSTGTAISVSSSLSDESTPPAGAKVQVVGYQFNSGTSAIALSGSLVRFTDSAKDLTTLGLIEGEWVYVGGDAAGVAFPTAGNTGWARIGVNGIAAGYLEFDRVSWTPTAEVGTSKTIQVFFGSVLKNEDDPALIVRRTYNVERTLGEDDDGTMSEYLVGAVANELTINVPQASKVTTDLSYVALDNEQRDGATGVKTGSRPTLVAEECFNTSSDLTRISLAEVSVVDSTVTDLFAYATELTLTVKNGVTPNKALGVLGGFDTSAGTFEVGGKLTVYFANVAAVQAVRNNADITLDLILSKNNSAILFDIPLLGLGDGRLAVEQDKAITLPLDMSAAESPFGHTFMFMHFAYLPDIAG
jgi:hypothetical protein